MAEYPKILSIKPTESDIRDFLQEAKALDISNNGTLEAEEVYEQTLHKVTFNLDFFSSETKYLAEEKKYQAGAYSGFAGSDAKNNKRRRYQEQLASLDLANKLMSKFKACETQEGVCSVNASQETRLSEEDIQELYESAHTEFFDAYYDRKKNTKLANDVANEAINHFVQLMNDADVQENPKRLALVGRLLVHYLQKVNEKDKAQYVQQHLAIVGLLNATLNSLAIIEDSTKAGVRKDVKALREELLGLHKTIEEVENALVGLKSSVPTSVTLTDKNIEDLAELTFEKIDALIKQTTLEALKGFKDLYPAISQETTVLLLPLALGSSGFSPMEMSIAEEDRLDLQQKQWWTYYSKHIATPRSIRDINDKIDISAPISDENFNKIYESYSEKISSQDSDSLACLSAMKTILDHPVLLAEEVQNFLEHPETQEILASLKGQDKAFLGSIVEELNKWENAEDFANHSEKTLELLKGWPPEDYAKVLAVVEQSYQLMKNLGIDDSSGVEELNSLYTSKLQELLSDPESITNAIKGLKSLGLQRRDAKNILRKIENTRSRVNAVVHLFGFGSLEDLAKDPKALAKVKSQFKEKLELYRKDPAAFVVHIGGDLENLFSSLSSSNSQNSEFKKAYQLTSQANSIVRHILSTDDWKAGEFILYGLSTVGSNVTALMVDSQQLDPFIASGAFLLNLNFELELARRGWILPEALVKGGNTKLGFINDMEIPLPSDGKFYQFSFVLGQGYAYDFKSTENSQRFNVRSLARYTFPYSNYPGKASVYFHPYVQGGIDSEIWHRELGNPTGEVSVAWGAGLRIFFDKPKLWKPFLRVGYEGGRILGRDQTAHSGIIGFGLADPWNAVSAKKNKVKCLKK
ncbi:MAG: hypothetical protein KDK66_06575 [Deltaproteobacteria bacterium]|nr:hypothetical protein [Deltaproteobacteria bacterium]